MYRAGFMLSLAFAVSVQANGVIARGQSNKDSVRDSIEEGSWQVIYGEELGSREYSNLCSALVASTGPQLDKYVQHWQKRICTLSLGDQNVISKTISLAIDRRGEWLKLEKLELKFDFAKYEAWTTVNYPEVENVWTKTTVRGPLEAEITVRRLTPRTIMKERRIPLPSTVQPYFAVRISGAWALVEVDSVPPCAVIEVAKKPWGTTKAVKFVNPGTLILIASKPGFVAESKTLNASGGKCYRVDFSLTKAQ